MRPQAGPGLQPLDLLTPGPACWGVALRAPPKGVPEADPLPKAGCASARRLWHPVATRSSAIAPVDTPCRPAVLPSPPGAGFLLVTL